jgi:hypothetical protein
LNVLGSQADQLFGEALKEQENTDRAKKHITCDSLLLSKMEALYYKIETTEAPRQGLKDENTSSLKHESTSSWTSC